MEPITRTSSIERTSKVSCFDESHLTKSRKKSYFAKIIQFDLINFFTYFCITTFDLVYNFLNQMSDTDLHLRIFIFPLMYSGISLLIAFFLLLFRDKIARRHPNNKWCTDPKLVNRTLRGVQLFIFFYLLELNVFLIKLSDDGDCQGFGEKKLLFMLFTLGYAKLLVGNKILMGNWAIGVLIDIMFLSQLTKFKIGKCFCH